MNAVVLLLIIGASAFAQSKALVMKGKFFRRGPKIFFAREYQAIAPSYEVVFKRKVSSISEICMSNEASDCPTYQISFAKVQRVKSGLKIIGVEVLMFQFE